MSVSPSWATYSGTVFHAGSSGIRVFGKNAVLGAAVNHAGRSNCTQAVHICSIFLIYTQRRSEFHRSHGRGILIQGWGCSLHLAATLLMRYCAENRDIFYMCACANKCAKIQHDCMYKATHKCTHFLTRLRNLFRCVARYGCIVLVVISL